MSSKPASSAAAATYTRPHRNLYAVSRHNFYSIPWPITGLKFALADLAHVLGRQRIDAKAFYGRLAFSVRCAAARGSNSALFTFEGVKVVIAPDPDFTGRWRIEVDAGDGPRPFDERLRVAACAMTEEAFDEQVEALRSRAILDGITPSAFIGCRRHIFEENASRFADKFRNPETGEVVDWDDVIERLCDKGNLAVAHGTVAPYFFFPRACAQLAIPVHGLGAGWNQGLFLAVGFGVDKLSNEPCLKVPTVLAPSMVRDNFRQLERLRWYWRAGFKAA